MTTGIKLKFRPRPPITAGMDVHPGARGHERPFWFTLIEIMISVCIFGLLTAIATPFYARYRERARVAVAVSDIKAIETAVLNYADDHRSLPKSLDQIGPEQLDDPWGLPYQYLRIEGEPNSIRGSTRKDHFMVPVNSDFDLYSKGKDGASVPLFTAKASQDDIVRAYNGGYCGMVREM